jgi:hypothetical protein
VDDLALQHAHDLFFVYHMHTWVSYLTCVSLTEASQHFLSLLISGEKMVIK